MRNPLPLVLLCASPAFGAAAPKPFSLTCSASSATLRVWVEGDRLRFHLEDGQGFDNFPVYSGVVTKPMVPLIERGVKELAAFNGVVDVSWDKSKCQFDVLRPLLVFCHGKVDFTQPEKAGLAATSLSTEQDQVETLEVKAKTVTVNLAMSTTGTEFAHYFLTFPFDGGHCTRN